MVTSMTTSLLRSRLTAVLLAALVAVPVLRAATRGPDPAGYTATDETVYSFVDISASGASVLADTDDGTASLTLPFPFSFYGAPRTLLCVSSNGAAYFVNAIGDCAVIVTDFANTDLSTTSPPGDWPSLLPFWTDLTFDQPGAGAVYYHTTGVPGTRLFIVQWERAYPSGSSSPVTFQMMLSEGTGAVLFQYKTVDLGGGNPATRGGTATIGTRNSNAVVSGEYLQWSYNVPVVPNESAIATSAQVMTANLSLAPANAVNRPGTSHTVTATATSSTGAPVPGVTVTFDVLTGPNSAADGSAVTNAAGQASFTYTDSSAPPWPRIDTIQAAVGSTTSNVVQKVWVLKCDANSDNRIHGPDLAVIRAAIGQVASGPYDPRDGNSDGVINAADQRYCQLRFTVPAK